jgi:hypothetical protein
MDQHEAFGLITHLEMYRTLHHLEMDVVSFFLHVQMLSTISFVTNSGCLIMIVYYNSSLFKVSSFLPSSVKPQIPSNGYTVYSKYPAGVYPCFGIILTA